MLQVVSDQNILNLKLNALEVKCRPQYDVRILNPKGFCVLQDAGLAVCSCCLAQQNSINFLVSFRNGKSLELGIVVASLSQWQMTRMHFSYFLKSIFAKILAFFFTVTLKQY